MIIACARETMPAFSKVSWYRAIFIVESHWSTEVRSSSTSFVFDWLSGDGQEDVDWLLEPTTLSIWIRSGGWETGVGNERRYDKCNNTMPKF